MVLRVLSRMKPLRLSLSDQLLLSFNDKLRLEEEKINSNDSYDVISASS